MINVIIAFTVADARKLRDNFDKLPQNVQEALREASFQTVNNKTRWKRPKRSGKTFVIMDIIIRRSWIARIKSRFPNTVIVRAWEKDGSQVGTTRLINKTTGAVVLTGAPRHSGLTKAQLLSVMPDVEAADGTTTPATVLSDAFGHTWLGWGTRDYSL